MANQNAGQTSDLDTLLPVVPVVKLDGKPYEVREVRVGGLREFITAAAPLWETFQKYKNDKQGLLSSLMTQQIDNAIKLVAAGLNVPVETVNQADPREMTEALFTVVEVNSNFFILNVLPLLLQKSVGFASAMTELQKSAVTAGMTESKA